MDNWILPYKQIILDSGLLVLFEQSPVPGAENTSLFQLVRADNAFLLKVGKNHLVPLSVNTIDCLMRTRRLYFAVSKKDDLYGGLVGILDIDDVAVGKLVAYLEVAAIDSASKPG
ncbi:MAG: hypothetical protein WCJ37_02030 [Syntrophus sp. (in: bacteria)]